MSERNERIEILKTLCQTGGKIKIECEEELADFCEDVNKVVRTRASVRINNKNVYPSGSGIEAQISGVCEFGVLYVSNRRSGEGKLSYAAFTGEFSHSFETPVDALFDEENLWAVFEAIPENVVCRPLGPRKLQLRCEINLGVCVKGNLLVDCLGAQNEEGLEEKSDSVRAARLVKSASHEFELSDELTLPADYPEIGKLLDCDVKLFCESCKTVADKLIFNGLAVLTCSYLPDGDPEESLAPVSFVQPVEVSQLMEIDGCNPDQIARAVLYPVDLKVKIGENNVGENKKIGFGINYLAGAAVFENRPISWMGDCYSTDRELKITRSQTSAEEILASFEQVSPLELTFELADPEAAELECIRASFDLGECVAERQNILAKGKLSVSMLGVKKDGSVVPIKEEAEGSVNIRPDSSVNLSGMDPSVRLEVMAQVKEISCQNTGSQIRAQAQIASHVTLVGNRNLDYVTGVECLEPIGAKDDSAVIVYYPEKDEDPWEIGKMFAVPMASIQREMEKNAGKMPAVLTLIP